MYRYRNFSLLHCILFVGSSRDVNFHYFRKLLGFLLCGIVRVSFLRIDDVFS